MQGTNEGISEILNVRKLLVAMVDQQCTGKHPKYKQTKVASDGAGKDGANHRRLFRLHTT